MNNLEVWLMGTPAEVDAALAALGEAGRITELSKAQRLFGADSGRVRRYARVAVPTRTAQGRAAA